MDTVIGLDAELLNETPNPRQYNGTLRERLKVLGKKGPAASDVVEQMKWDSDLMPQNMLLNEIAKHVKQIGIDELRVMPIGRRSGKSGGDKNECILAYVRTRPERRVYFVVYDYERDEADVPENEYDAVSKARCPPDEGMYLPMDGGDHRKSFEELIRIDKKAREAIIYSDDVVRQYARSLENTGFEKARTRLVSVITAAYRFGKIDSDSAGRADAVINSAQLRPWSVELQDMVDGYERDGDADVLIKEIERIGKQVGTGTEDVDADAEIDYDGMKLVDAMFITPPPQKGKSDDGLDSHM